MNPTALSQTKTSAPALSRGLAVFAALSEQQIPLSLEDISARLHLPKASVFRFVQTLLTAGLIRKTANKRYEPLWSLHPLTDDQTLCRQRIEKAADSLCETTQCTVEWYEPVSEGMRLSFQRHPESEVRVQARPGFLRTWIGELEAVARLAYAYSPDAPPLKRIPMFTEDGVLENLSKREAAKWIRTARLNRTAADGAYNVNGVRRSAAAAFGSAGNSFLGVLALAEVHHFAPRPAAKEFLPLLKQTLGYA